MTPYYQDEWCTIYHGDARDLIVSMDRMFDLVVADPPYMINTKSDGRGKLEPWADLCNASLWYERWLSDCKRKLHPHGALWTFLNWRSFVTFQRASCSLQWPIESVLVWDKVAIGPGGQKGLRPTYELVALFAQPEFAISNRSIADIYRVNWPTVKPHGHAAEKPVALIEWLCTLSGCQALLDPFMGSGSGMVAAKKLGIHSVGIEIEERWCEVAANRLRQEFLPLTWAAHAMAEPEQKALFA